MSAAFGIALALAGWATYLSVWGRSGRARLSAIILLALSIPSALAMESLTLSRPLPTTMEWWLRSAQEATVLGATLKEGEAIYLWLQVPGAEEPRYYSMPWDEQAAEQLRAAMEKARETGQNAMMRLPFEDSLEDRGHKFYPPPQPALLPDKLEPPPAQVWEQPA